MDNNIFLADIRAYEGKFSEAAKLYRKSGHDQSAMNMYTDLRMFDLAQVQYCPWERFLFAMFLSFSISEALFYTPENTIHQ